jgi:hypothetical protein
MHDRITELYTAPADALTKDELKAWVEGYLAGWERGDADGYARAYAESDALIAGALTQMLGGPDCTDRAEAVRRHLRTVEARRARA